MNCSKKLSDQLGVTSAFNDELLERIEENINDKDSLLPIIDEIFWLTNKHLQESGKDDLSAFILTGAWIEALHLAGKSISLENPNPALADEVAKQKKSLTLLIELLSNYTSQEIVGVKEKLDVLQTLYNKIENTKKGLVYDNNTIFSIITKIEEIRTGIIS